MPYTLPSLPYDRDALAPFLSAETFDYHHGKHHRGYVDKLNGALEGTDSEGLPFLEVLKNAEGGLYNLAAQHFNHSFFWRCLTPERTAPEGELRDAIERDFGSLEKFQEAFTDAAVKHFGSGWAWLVRDAAGKLALRATSDAVCPLSQGETPLLTCDVWEHAYYIDYRNDRPSYVKGFWERVDWRFVGRCFANPEGIEAEIFELSTSDS